jgi:hypothetical protein
VPLLALPGPAGAAVLAHPATSPRPGSVKAVFEAGQSVVDVLTAALDEAVGIQTRVAPGVYELSV